MPEHANLYLSVVAEVLMIVHLARKEGIGTGTQSLIQQEVPCPTANGDAFHGTGQQFVVHQALHSEGLLHPLQESQRVFSFRQIAYHARTGLHRVCLRTYAHRHLSRLKQHYIHQAEPLCHHIVHAIHSGIQIRVSRIDGNVILQSQTHATLHGIIIRQMLQCMEYQRMMRHYHVASQIQCLAYHILGHVKAQ